MRIRVVVGHAAGIPRKSRGVFGVTDAREVPLRLSRSDCTNRAAGPVSVSSTQ